MTPIVSNNAWEIVGLDIVPFTLRNNEKKNALVMVDYFSKEILATSLNSLKSEEVISKMEQELVWPKRCPSKIISDRGPQLMSGEIKQWMESRAIKHSPTTAYHQQANGQVERMIQSFKQVVQNKLTQRMKWKEALKAACSSMNNFLRNSTTKYTPYEIIHGEKYHSINDNIIRAKRNMIWRKKVQAQKNTEKAKETQATNYDKGKNPRKLKEGDWTLVFNHQKKRYTDDTWIGPYQIIKVMENDNYLIHNHLTDKYRKYNIQHIKKYHPITDTTNTLNETKNMDIPPTPGKPTVPPPLPTYAPTTIPLQHTAIPKPNPRIGERVKVYWPDYNKWYTGTIVNKSNEADGGTHDIRYDDEPDKEPISETLEGKGQVQWEALPKGDTTVLM